MPHFDIIRRTEPKKSFRVATVMGTYDLQQRNVEEHFIGDIDLPEKWSIGLIVGRSGTGKTTIARELFGDCIIDGFKYTHDNILDDMPKDVATNDIFKAFNACGFSSPPSWLKPYSVLSNGEKMRCDIARAMLECKGKFCFDEFTSVVDRDVAQIASFAIQKAIRKRGGAIRCRNMPLRCARLADARLGVQYGHDDVFSYRRGNAKKKSTSHQFAVLQNRSTRKTILLANI